MFSVQYYPHTFSQWGCLFQKWYYFQGTWQFSVDNVITRQKSWQLIHADLSMLTNIPEGGAKQAKQNWENCNQGCDDSLTQTLRVIIEQMLWNMVYFHVTFI